MTGRLTRRGKFALCFAAGLVIGSDVVLWVRANEVRDLRLGDIIAAFGPFAATLILVGITAWYAVAARQSADASTEANRMSIERDTRERSPLLFLFFDANERKTWLVNLSRSPVLLLESYIFEPESKRNHLVKYVHGSSRHNTNSSGSDSDATGPGERLDPGASRRIHDHADGGDRLEISVAIFRIWYGPWGAGPQWIKAEGVKWGAGPNGLEPPGRFEGQYASQYLEAEVLDEEPDFALLGTTAWADWSARSSSAAATALPPQVDDA